MSRFSGFVGGLKKSTKITLLSCSSFVLLTVLILVFFIMFPITPSEKIMSNFGRGENIFQGDDQNGSAQTAVPGVVTTDASSSAATEKVSTARSTVSTSRTSFKLNITTGSGFLYNGRIPTGVMPGGSTTTTVVDPDEPSEPNYPNTEPNEPNTPGIEPTAPYDPGVDPGTGGTEPDPGTGGTEPDPGTGGNDPNPNPGGNDPTPDPGGEPSPDPDS